MCAAKQCETQNDFVPFYGLEAFKFKQLVCLFYSSAHTHKGVRVPSLFGCLQYLNLHENSYIMDRTDHMSNEQRANNTDNFF